MSSKTVKILSEKQIHTADLFKINQVELEFPNGLKKTWENVVRQNAISIFPITDDYEIYLVKQYRYLYGKEMLEACAGFLNPGEDPKETAKRELQEETGLIAEEIIFLGNVLPSASVIKWNQYNFYAKGLSQGKTHFDDVEDIKLIKMPLEEAVEKVFSGEIETGPAQVGILMLDIMRREGKI